MGALALVLFVIGALLAAIGGSYKSLLRLLMVAGITMVAAGLLVMPPSWG